jgi:hypothetical protein
LAHFIGVTVGFGLWRVATLAVPAAIALTACCRSPRFRLAIFGLAIGTWFHFSKAFPDFKVAREGGKLRAV